MKSSASTKHFGKRAEDMAARFLQDKGYVIIAKNWSCKSGELDIVARYKDLLVFVEVKARHTHDAGDAFAAITPRKKSRLLQAIEAYLSTLAMVEPSWRLDAIAVTSYRGETILEHVEDVLGW